MVAKKRSGRVVGKSSGGNPAAAERRILVLEGTFSIEEIEVAGSRKKKTAKASKGKSPQKAARKKAVAKKARRTSAGSKRAAVKKTARKKGAPKATATPPAKQDDKESSQAGPVVLKPQQDIKSIAELQEQLGDAFGAGSDVVVDASRVEAIDTAALQLLAAFANSMREQSRTVDWKDPSPCFREMAELTDISSVLRLDEGPASGDDNLCPVF